jgi:hypothetical protein
VHDNITNYLIKGFGSYGGGMERARSRGQLVVSEEKKTPDAVVLTREKSNNQPSRQNSTIVVDVENEAAPKIGRLPSKRSNVSRPELVPTIRGDRVRGSNPRLVSDKARNRHQMTPQSSLSSGMVERSQSILSRADSKMTDATSVTSSNNHMSFKEVLTESEEIDTDDKSTTVAQLSSGKSFTNRSSRFSASMKFTADDTDLNGDDALDTDEVDTTDEKATPLHHDSDTMFFGDSTSLKKQLPGDSTDDIQNSQQSACDETSRATIRFQNSSFSYSRTGNHIPASAYSTGTLPNLDLEGDSEFWSTVKFDPQRQTLNKESGHELHAVAEVEETVSPTAIGGSSASIRDRPFDRNDNDDDDDYDEEQQLQNQQETDDTVESDIEKDAEVGLVVLRLLILLAHCVVKCCDF